MKRIKTPTTYQIGLMQTKFNRLLKQRTTKALIPTGINPPEWALLGVLYETPEGIRLKDLADVLGVEASFITTMSRSLKARKLVALMADADDNRAKKIYLSEEGKALVQTTEVSLRGVMRPIVKKIPISQLLAYFKTLNQMIDYLESEDTVNT